jgi:hypothetical protein
VIIETLDEGRCTYKSRMVSGSSLVLSVLVAMTSLLGGCPADDIASFESAAGLASFSVVRAVVLRADFRSCRRARCFRVLGELETDQHWESKAVREVIPIKAFVLAPLALLRPFAALGLTLP